MEQLHLLFENYIAFANSQPRESLLSKLVQDRREDPAAHPAHMAFFQDVAQWTASFIASHPSPETLSAALDVLLFTAPRHKDTPAYWYLVAVQRHALKLIPLLTEEVQRSIGARFDRQYPSSSRVPVQQEIHAALLPLNAARNRKTLSLPDWLRKKN